MTSKYLVNINVLPSHLRSSLMLRLPSMGLAHLFFSSLWRKMIIVLAAVALSLAKKAARSLLVHARYAPKSHFLKWATASPRRICVFCNGFLRHKFRNLASLESHHPIWTLKQTASADEER